MKKKITAILLMIITMMCGICSVVPVSADSGDYVNVVQKYNIKKWSNNLSLSIAAGDYYYILASYNNNIYVAPFFWVSSGWWGHDDYLSFNFSGNPNIATINTKTYIEMKLIDKIYNGPSVYSWIDFEIDCYIPDLDVRKASLTSFYLYGQSNIYVKSDDNFKDSITPIGYFKKSGALTESEIDEITGGDVDDLDFYAGRGITGHINSFGDYPELTESEFDYQFSNNKITYDTTTWDGSKTGSFDKTILSVNSVDGKPLELEYKWNGGFSYWMWEPQGLNNLFSALQSSYMGSNSTFDGQYINFSVNIPSDIDYDVSLSFYFQRYKYNIENGFLGSRLTYTTTGVQPIFFRGDSVNNLEKGKTYRYKFDVTGFTDIAENDILYFWVGTQQPQEDKRVEGNLYKDVFTITNGFSIVPNGTDYVRNNDNRYIQFIDDKNDIDDFDFNDDDNVPYEADGNVNDNVDYDKFKHSGNSNYNLDFNFDDIGSAISSSVNATKSLFSFAWSLFPAAFMTLLLGALGLIVILRVLGR